MRSAVVLGGSVAGLLAARVLADHAEDVCIVEPDDLRAGPRIRRGVPQGAHSHILLGRGREALEGLLPGLCAQLVADGAHLVDFEADGGWFLDGTQRVPIPGEDLLSLTRPFLEHHLRERVLALPRVRLMAGRATGLTITGDRVDGALVLADGAVDAQRVAADLVVDTTGRASRLADWLTRLGYEAPARHRVGVDIGYATCFFHRPAGQRLGGVTVAHSMRSGRTGRPGASSLNPVEGGLWMALVTGYPDDHPRRDLPDFLHRCRLDPALPMRLVAEACEPATEVATYRFPASVRRDFHRLRRFPAGLIAAGDAIASFNPVYGQGIASAALHAEVLAAWLRGGPELDRPAHRYFRGVGRVVHAAWLTSGVNDRLLPHVRTGPLSRRQRTRMRIGSMVAYASLVDLRVARVFGDVVNMRRHPHRMWWPDVLLRSALANRGRPRPAGEPAPGGYEGLLPTN